MSSSDGQVLSTTKIVNNGPDDRQWNLVILAEGFQESELDTFEQSAQDFVDILNATAPFDELWPEINVHRINISSTDSGADDPTECGGTGATPATYFDASFCNNSIRRLLTVDSGLAQQVANDGVPETHAVVVLVNSATYGGAGGTVATASLDNDASEIAIHELGHMAFGLADEYSSYVGCGSDDDDNDNHGTSEPSEPNVTSHPGRDELKWVDLVDSDTDLPTMSNPDCAECDTRASTVPPGTVGAFEGAHFYHCEAYRPEYDCKMRNLDQPFCAVCQQRIRETFQCWAGQFECIETRELRYGVCSATRDAGYAQCTQTRDDGYNQCTQTRDDGYNACCDWWPCSWVCAAFVWVSNIVCIAWTWISNIVCIAWTWISNIVCIAWTWISHIVCISWTWISNIVCVAWTWIVSEFCVLWRRLTC